MTLKLKECTHMCFTWSLVGRLEGEEGERLCDTQRIRSVGLPHVTATTQHQLLNISKTEEGGYCREYKRFTSYFTSQGIKAVHQICAGVKVQLVSIQCAIQ
ncbi:hypothetical protein NQZ68_041549 [Dissostichus eleginoides]|nr:hypothetical protein NQZ68_041549 [Dissostichus eleginoides]